MAKRRSKASEGPYLIHLQLLRDRVPSFGRFPYSLPVVRNLDCMRFHPKVTFLVGGEQKGTDTIIEVAFYTPLPNIADRKGARPLCISLCIYVVLYKH